MKALACLGLLGTGLVCVWILGEEAAAKAQAPVNAATTFEIQTRGFVHEAFAQPLDPMPQPGPVAPTQPPPPIPEQPPDLRPEGASVQWLDGYWAWDAERNTFDWISGTYRDVPPGQRYVPGYWQQTTDGWQWVSGFWAGNEQLEIPYVPQPPASLEIGPSVPPPAEDYFYIPGIWTYRDSRFAWRPGYYAQYRPGFVWIPAHYNVTPAGWIFVNGCWDYPLERRGLLFAPVTFSRPLWTDPTWAWRPQYTVGFSALFDCLFIDARFGRYRFGDYYGSAYVARGIHPWHTYGPTRYDPLYNYARWQHRADPGWQTRLATVHDNRVAGRDPRPPRTLTQLTQLPQQNLTVGNARLVQPVTQLSNVNLVKVNAANQAQQQALIRQQRDATEIRAKTEKEFAKQRALPEGRSAPPRTLKLPDTQLATAGKGLVGEPAAPKSPATPGAPAKAQQPPPAQPKGNVNPPLKAEGKQAQPPPAKAQQPSVVQPKGNVNPPPKTDVKPVQPPPAKAQQPLPAQPKGNVNPPLKAESKQAQPSPATAQQPSAVQPKGNVNPPPKAEVKPAQPPPAKAQQPPPAQLKGNVNPPPKAAVAPAQPAPAKTPQPAPAQPKANVNPPPKAAVKPAQPAPAQPKVNVNPPPKAAVKPAAQPAPRAQPQPAPKAATPAPPRAAPAAKPPPARQTQAQSAPQRQVQARPAPRPAPAANSGKSNAGKKK